MKKNISKSILIAMFVFTLVLMSGCGKSVDVTADFSLGYEGVVKVAEGNPLVAKINNMGDEFAGELQIEVAVDGQNKMIFSKAFDMPKSAEKEIKMHTPIYMIEKSFEVKIVADNRVVYSEKIVPTDYISPEHTVVAVISDKPDKYRFVNSLSLPKYRYDNEFMSTFQYSKSMYGPVSAISSTMPMPVFDEDNTLKTHILYFDSFAEFTEKVNYDYMDYIYIGESDNLNMTKEVEAYLIEWMKGGNTLFVETGADYKKILSQLPSSLINYDIKGTETLEFGSQFDQDNVSFDAVIGEVNETVGGDYLPLFDMNFGVSTPFGAGNLVTLRMDLGDQPFSDALYTSAVLSEIVASTRDKTVYYEEEYYGYYDMSYRLGRIPDEKAPPYWLMIVIFFIYIVIVGPILYLVFKLTDKRDYLWVAIPATAMVCLLVLYLVGLQTRFNQPITNSISSIVFTDGDDYFDVTTDIAFFNNKNEDVVISWSENENINLNSTERYYWGEPQDNKKLIGKMMVGKQNQYTAYNTPLWTPTFMKATKVVPLTNKMDKPMVKVAEGADGEAYEFTNITPLKMTYAFMMVGNSIYTIGDVEPFETVVVSNGFTGDIYQYIDTVLAPNLYNDYTAEGRKKQADIELLREKAESYYYQRVENQKGMPTDVSVFGLNLDAIGYEMDINNEDTEDFNRNILQYKGAITYEPGTVVKLGHGRIPTEYTFDSMNGHMYAYNDYNAGMVVDLYNLNECYYNFNIPTFIDVNEVELKLDNIYRMEDWHQIYNGYSGAPPVNTEFALYNYTTGDWDIIEMNEDKNSTFVEIKMQDYVQNEGMEVRVVINEGLVSSQTKEMSMMMVMPTISVKGVAK